MHVNAVMIQDSVSKMGSFQVIGLQLNEKAMKIENSKVMKAEVDKMMNYANKENEVCKNSDYFCKMSAILKL